jgi:RNA polymerase sigma-70 factor (ECF subfamily)
MADTTEELGDLVERARGGDEAALARLFAVHRDRLRRMVQLRLDHRLQGRVDPSDVLQEAYLDASTKFRDYQGTPDLPLFIWLRLVVGERLLRVHRQHLGAAMRDAAREVSIHQGPSQQASSEFLAAQLLGRLTSASLAVARAEMQGLLREALDRMDPMDREVIALRHFEELSNDEAASVLGVTNAAASKRYVRALLRLKAAVSNVPGLAEFARSTFGGPAPEA